MNEKDDDIEHPGMVSKPEKTPDFGLIHYFAGDSFHSWLRGMMEYHGDERLHQFIRAVEAVVMSPKGKGTALFAHRSQLFAGTSAPVVAKKSLIATSARGVGAENLSSFPQ